MVETDKYIKNLERFERQLTIKDKKELYETYMKPPNCYRNEIPKSFKTSDSLTHAFGIIFVKNQHE